MVPPVTVTEAAAIDWIATLSRTRAVFFPQLATDGGRRFERVHTDTPLRFEGYQPTVLPPGKLLSPAEDVLFTFEARADGGFDARPALDDTPRIIAGVRPCDVKAIRLMDRVNRQEPADPQYLTRRSATLIIGYACASPCTSRCFCQSTGALDDREGADVWLTPTDGALLVEPLTEAGVALLDSLEGTPCDDPEAARARHRDARPEPFGRQLPGTPDQLRAVLLQTWRSDIWRQHTARCLSCGTCNLVCPTCYCFDTHDQIDVSNPGCGSRCRSWDSCMLPEFASVAGGHDFRRTPAARQRHRVKRKFEYLPGHHDDTFCVGCGRCGTQCTTNIDIFDIACDLLGGAA